ncbi:MAG: AAA family ATPase [Gammaproteobacteria bacterium]|nr:AAA family ATPase [Gammaproteobacteria bacterium]
MPSADSGFVAEWGLRFDPFAPDADLPFFAGTGFAAALEQLEHYCRYGNMLLVVTGPSGSGKTMLRKEFVRRYAEEAEVCALLAHPLHTTTQILHQVAEALGLGDDLSQGREVEVEGFLRRLATGGDTPRVLVVDDADTLDHSVVEALVLLAHRLREQTEPPLKLVLFGEPHLSAMLAQTGVSGSREDVYFLSLPPLAVAETGDYLQHRLAAAGFSQNLPLTPQQLEALHKAGQGLPAAINRQAGHFLSELLTIASALEVESVSLSPAMKRSLLGLGAVLLLGVLVLQLPKLFEAEPQAGRPAGTLPGMSVAPAPAVKPEVPAPQPEAAAPLLGTDAPASGNAATAAPVAGATSETPAQAMPPAESLPVTPPAEPVAQPEAAPTVVAAQPETPAPAAKAEPATAATKPAAEPRKASKPKAKAVAAEAAPALAMSLPRNEEGLKAASPRHYTLQLVGLSDKAKVDAYIRRHGLSGELRVYRTERAGKPMYVLTYGLYPSRNAALAAAAGLPSLPEKPWAKSLAAVHKDMAAH